MKEEPCLTLTISGAGYGIRTFSLWSMRRFAIIQPGPRAAITLTWVAVCLDIIEKLRRLAEDGEPAAKTIVEQIDGAYEESESNAVKIMQDVERTILITAKQVELIDTIGERELRRLREDRHLCAHPSLRPAGEFYDPRPEYARAHLSTALHTLLVHPPIQGRKVIERFRAHLLEQTFTYCDRKPMRGCREVSSMRTRVGP
jgi:hypothetical protein